MAGGKETPRQKMIGMMYLVLTALLALNVSKQVLDAFVAIEENIQRGTLTQLDKGDGNRSELTTEMSQVTNDEAGRAKKAKIKLYLDIINKIDVETGKVVGKIDEIKMLLLEKSKEDIKTIKDKDEKTIVWKKYDKNDPLRPARLNLMAVQAKDQFDVPMHEIVGSEITKLEPNKEGIKLWKMYNDYRAKLVELTGSYKEGERKYLVKTKAINTFKSNIDLDEQVRKMINGSGNKPNKEDVEMLVGIYEELTKQEFADHHEQKNIHWMGRTFDHAPLVGALASLSSLQNEILSARAKAIGVLKGKISSGQYSFNKVVGLAYPETAVLNPGDEFEMTVMMAAFDSDKKPQVKPAQGTVVSNEDGHAIVKLRAPSSGEMKISGQVGIADKSGNVVWKSYDTKIQVATKAGSISLPELNVLYTDWDNKVVAVASGVLSTNISAPGAQVVPSTINGQKGFIVRVTPSLREVNISLSGKDAKGKSISFGSTKYKVKPFPKPRLTIDQISKSSNTRMRVSLGPDSPLGDIEFDVTGGAITVGPDRMTFSGPLVPSTLLAKAKVGRDVAVFIQCKRKGSTKPITFKGSLEVTP